MQVIVEQQDQVADEIVARLIECLSPTNWEVGKLAAEWKAKTGRTDANLADRVGLTSSQISQRRKVWERFGDSKVDAHQLSWSHYYAAAGWDDAEECLQVAAEDGLSVADFIRWHDATKTAGKPSTDAQTSLTASDVPDKPVQPPLFAPADDEKPTKGKTKAKETNTAESPADRNSADSAQGSAAVVAPSVPLTKSSVKQHVTLCVQKLAAEAAEANASGEWLASQLRREANKLDRQKKKAKKLTGVPTDRQLIAEIPSSWSDRLREAAADWAKHKQTLPAKSKVRTLDQWAKALERIAKYRPAIAVEAIDVAISSGWVGWEQESVKEKLKTSASRPRKREWKE